MKLEKNEKTCYIFAAAPIERDQRLEDISDGDLVVAADGGFGFTSDRGINIDICLGDFDSLGKKPSGDFRLMEYPVRKDDTDTGIAVRYGLLRGYRRFVIYGGLGGKRRSHTVSNCQTLAYIAENGGRGYLVENENFITAISSGQNIELMPEPFDSDSKLSVFALSGRCTGVDIENTQYDVANAELSFDHPLGEGNGFVEGKAARISVKNGSLLIVYEE